MTRGQFITLEGGEGAGKSTQALALARWLGDRGVDVLRTREPGGTPGGDALRALLLQAGSSGRAGGLPAWDPVTETLLHFAARREHVVQRIAPALEAGTWVVCDRFTDSTMAYQCYGSGVPIGVADVLVSSVLGGLGPDLTFILDVDPRLGLARTALRGTPDGYERRGLAFHQRVRDGFLSIAAAHAGRCVLIDASASAAATTDGLRRFVERRFDIAA